MPSSWANTIYMMSVICRVTHWLLGLPTSRTCRAPEWLTAFKRQYFKEQLLLQRQTRNSLKTYPDGPGIPVLSTTSHASVPIHYVLECALESKLFAATRTCYSSTLRLLVSRHHGSTQGHVIHHLGVYLLVYLARVGRTFLYLAVPPVTTADKD